MELAGDVLYAAHRNFGVELIDVSDPRSPQHLSLIRTGEAQSVVSRDGFLYVGVWASSELVVVDARNPAANLPSPRDVPSMATAMVSMSKETLPTWPQGITPEAQPTRNPAIPDSVRAMDWRSSVSMTLLSLSLYRASNFHPSTRSEMICGPLPSRTIWHLSPIPGMGSSSSML